LRPVGQRGDRRGHGQGCYPLQACPGPPPPPKARPFVRLPHPYTITQSHNPAGAHKSPCAPQDPRDMPPMVSPQNTHRTSLRQAWPKGCSYGSYVALFICRGDTSELPRRHVASAAEARRTCRGGTPHLPRRHVAPAAEALCVNCRGGTLRQLPRRHFASAAEALRICRGGTSRLPRRHFASAAEALRICRGGTSHLPRRHRGDAWSAAEAPPGCRGGVPRGSGAAEAAAGDHDRRGGTMLGPCCRGGVPASWAAAETPRAAAEAPLQHSCRGGVRVAAEYPRQAAENLGGALRRSGEMASQHIHSGWSSV
jgi:hypothetical protein